MIVLSLQWIKVNISRCNIYFKNKKYEEKENALD